METIERLLKSRLACNIAMYVSLVFAILSALFMAASGVCALVIHWLWIVGMVFSGICCGVCIGIFGYLFGM